MCARRCCKQKPQKLFDRDKMQQTYGLCCLCMWYNNKCSLQVPDVTQQCWSSVSSLARSSSQGHANFAQSRQEHAGQVENSMPGHVWHHVGHISFCNWQQQAGLGTAQCVHLWRPRAPRNVHPQIGQDHLKNALTLTVSMLGSQTCVTQGTLRYANASRLGCLYICLLCRRAMSSIQKYGADCRNQ